jgi:hypothetical protein
MIAAGLTRAAARRPIWPLVIAGVAAAPVFLASPALAGPVTAARPPAAPAVSQVVTNCGSGVSAVTVRPAPGFHPLTATPAQLAANGLPLRPAGRAELAAWRRFVTGGVQAARTTCTFAPVTTSSAPRSIIGDTQPASSQSIIGDTKPASPQSIIGDTGPAISQSIIGDAPLALGSLKPPAASPRPSPGGNRATAATRTVAYGTWRVTRPRNDPAAAASSWVGIGAGRSAGPLIQAGSAAGGYFGPYLWWRVVPQRPNEQRISLGTAAGDTVYARIQLQSGRATVTIRDENSGAGGTYVLHYQQLDG